jgi:hypothetical protein
MKFNIPKESTYDKTQNLGEKMKILKSIHNVNTNKEPNKNQMCTIPYNNLPNDLDKLEYIIARNGTGMIDIMSIYGTQHINRNTTPGTTTATVSNYMKNKCMGHVNTKFPKVPLKLEKFENMNKFSYTKYNSSNYLKLYLFFISLILILILIYKLN